MRPPLMAALLLACVSDSAQAEVILDMLSIAGPGTNGFNGLAGNRTFDATHALGLCLYLHGDH